jgi:hypothetical protein
VNWEVNGTVGGSATFGTIDATGIYTAPATVPSPAQLTITAVSQADANVTATYPIMIALAPTAAPPAAQTISAGATANFSTALTGGTGSPSTPITLSCKQSTMPPGGVCTFTPATITPGSADVSFGLSVRVPARSAAVQRTNEGWLAAEVYFTFAPMVGILLLAGSRRKSRRWLGLMVLSLFLIALAACGGGGSTQPPPPNPVTYHIQVMGTSASQPNPVLITTVTLTVQ